MFDPEMAAFLDRVPPLKESIYPEHIDALRRGADRLSLSDDALARDGLIVVQRYEAIDSLGAAIPIIMLRAASAARPLSPIVFLHGGGMVSGNETTGIGAVSDWVLEEDFCVLSVDYRLAPEHRHPAPVEDCVAALKWIDASRFALGLNEAPLILVGASAGGGLAAGATLLALECDGPLIGELMLFAPMLDDRAQTRSSTMFDGDAPWDARSNLTGWSALLGDDHGGDVPASAAPARACDLTGFPPTYLDVGSAETFRDETVAFATRLLAADVPVELHVWSGAFHGFDQLAPQTRLAQAARDTRLSYLRRRLRGRA